MIRRVGECVVPSGGYRLKEVSNKKVVVAMYEPSSNKEGDENKEEGFGFQERGRRNRHNDN